MALKLVQKLQAAREGIPAAAPVIAHDCGERSRDSARGVACPLPLDRHERLTAGHMNKPEQGNRSRIDLDDPDEVSYWTDELNCSEKVLREVVADVGDAAAAVREVLGK